MQARAYLGQFSRREVDAFLLYFGSFSLLVSAPLLSVSTLEKRPELRFHLRDSSREVGQLASDQRDVVLSGHFA